MMVRAPASQFGKRLPTGSDTNIVIVAVNYKNKFNYEISAAYNPSLPKINLTSVTGENIPSMSLVHSSASTSTLRQTLEKY